MKHEIRLPASCCHGDQYEDYESIRAEKHDQALHVPYESRVDFCSQIYLGYKQRKLTNEFGYRKECVCPRAL
ncbi:hypothetical protein P5673_019303 [Acropora cervicornis]|uniref:Uncharacterized protein n=1 Tax=Acropora cervicornis TaxID=6130 RepID=A0AAD9QBD3_ACRCE|nr:hypothetical protein P5673_019303 [Acropora cervicornis]